MFWLAVVSTQERLVFDWPEATDRKISLKQPLNYCYFIRITVRCDYEDSFSTISLAVRVMTSSDLIRDLLQAKLELQDEGLLEQFWFAEGGHVVATLGTKNGAVCAPVLRYKITDDDAVEITSFDGARLYRWEQAQVRGNVLIVLCEGISKRFSITRTTKKERWLP